MALEPGGHDSTGPHGMVSPPSPLSTEIISASTPHLLLLLLQPSSSSSIGRRWTLRRVEGDIIVRLCYGSIFDAAAERMKWTRLALCTVQWRVLLLLWLLLLLCDSLFFVSSSLSLHQTWLVIGHCHYCNITVAPNLLAVPADCCCLFSNKKNDK